MANTIQALSAKDRSTGASSISASDRRTVVSFYGNSTSIAAGDFVCFDTTKTGADRVVYVTEADSDAAITQQPIGVAIDACAAVGDVVRVVVKGYVEGANVHADTVAGDLLDAGSVAGRGVVYAGGHNRLPIAQALEADTANVADVWVFGYFA